MSQLSKYTPQQLAQLVQSGQITEDELSGMDHATLYQARKFVPSKLQSLLADPEHQAYAREAVTDDPLIMAPFLAAAIPGYYAKKKLTGEGRSEPSLSQMGSAFTGIGQGLGQAASNKLAALLRR